MSHINRKRKRAARESFGERGLTAKKLKFWEIERGEKKKTTAGV